jgi:hypothetical protein
LRVLRSPGLIGGVSNAPLPYFTPIPQWNGHRIDVRAVLVPKFLWSTASIDVYLDNVRILRTGGKLKATGLVETAFTDDNGTHQVSLTWGVGWLFAFPFVLYIDGEMIANARVRVSNWPLGIGLWLGVLTAVILFRVLRVTWHH